MLTGGNTAIIYTCVGRADAASFAPSPSADKVLQDRAAISQRTDIKPRKGSRERFPPSGRMIGQHADNHLSPESGPMPRLSGWPFHQTERTTEVQYRH